MSNNRCSPPLWVNGPVGEAGMNHRVPLVKQWTEEKNIWFCECISQKILSWGKLSWYLNREPKGEWKLTRIRTGEGRGRRACHNALCEMWSGICGGALGVGQGGCSTHGGMFTALAEAGKWCVCVCARARVCVCARARVLAGGGADRIRPNKECLS